MNEASNCHRCHWLQLLKKKNLKPELIILEKVIGEWQEIERFWISYAKMCGWRLTNNTSGGDGVRDLPEETRERIRKVWLGRKHKPESLIKIGKASSERRCSKETKDKMSKAHAGREIKWKDKIAVANKKLSKEMQNDILEAIKNGEMVINLARKYGVHRTTISKVKDRTYNNQKRYYKKVL
jgi:hypothetical protein